ncbi:MAG: helix-turn-helix transcriptional regulator [Oscillibacter sp.]|nr:helix-turn-helix transcriptional regulator [Oscillibacter sp.]
MGLDYKLIGKRIAQRRKKLALTQVKVAEQVEISEQYLSNIERAVSIPSTEVVMRLALALDTTPDEFLIGAARVEGERWKNVAELLRAMDEKQLDLTESFIRWVIECQ